MLIRSVLMTTFIAGSVVLGLAGAPRADEVTTTTTTKNPQPDAVVTVPAPAVGVEVAKPDCTKKKVTTSNDQGDTTTSKTTNCD